MKSNSKIAIVAGATGLTGELLTRKLLNSPEYSKVKVIVRRPLSLKSDKLETILIQDLSEIPILADRAHADVFFCCLGTTIKNAGSREAFKKVDYTAILDFAKLAEQQNAKQFLLISALGANAKSSIFYNKTKGQTEEAISKLNIPSITIFRPALLLGQRREFRFAEYLAATVVKTIEKILPKSIVQKIATSVEDLASCMVEKSLKPTLGVELVTEIK